MGRNLHHAVRPERGVPELDRLRQPRGRRRLTVSRALFQYLRGYCCCFAALLFVNQVVLAADLSPGPENGAEAACSEIKTALHALSDAEHDESLALDLASSGGNSAAIVEARLSVLLDRTNDLRVVLRRVRQSKVARDPMVDQCTRMGFRALVMSEKLSSVVEGVLFDADDSVAAAPLKSTPPASPPAPQP